MVGLLSVVLGQAVLAHCMAGVEHKSKRLPTILRCCCRQQLEHSAGLRNDKAGAPPPDTASPVVDGSHPCGRCSGFAQDMPVAQRLHRALLYDV